MCFKKYLVSKVRGDIMAHASHTKHCKLDQNFKLELKYMEAKRMLFEKTEELKRRDQIIALLENEIDCKDASIRYLKNEIDKYRQVVQPLTKQLIDHHKSGTEGEEEGFVMKAPAGVENTRVLPIVAQRLKRTAISAEPLSSLNVDTEMKLVKIPKPQK